MSSATNPTNGAAAIVALKTAATTAQALSPTFSIKEANWTNH